MTGQGSAQEHHLSGLGTVWAMLQCSVAQGWRLVLLWWSLWHHPSFVPSRSERLKPLWGHEMSWELWGC